MSAKSKKEPAVIRIEAPALREIPDIGFLTNGMTVNIFSQLDDENPTEWSVKSYKEQLTAVYRVSFDGERWLLFGRYFSNGRITWARYRLVNSAAEFVSDHFVDCYIFSDLDESLPLIKQVKRDIQRYDDAIWDVRRKWRAKLLDKAKAEAERKCKIDGFGTTEKWVERKRWIEEETRDLRDRLYSKGIGKRDQNTIANHQYQIDFLNKLIQAIVDLHNSLHDLYRNSQEVTLL